MPKTYILSPTFSLGHQALKLGDILTNPLGPDLDPINHRARLPIDPLDLHEPTIQGGFSSTRKDLLSGRFTLWATVLATLGIPADIDIELFFERNSRDVIRADTLETQTFVVTREYVTKVLEQPSVAAYLKNAGYKPVYIVSGVKIAKGAAVNMTRSIDVDAEIGMSLENIAVDVGSAARFIRTRTEGVKSTFETPFVLAFRVHRITFEGGTKTELSTRGASMLDGGSKARKVPQAELGEELSAIEAKCEADVERVGVRVVEEEDGDVEWVITDGQYQ
jgi:hypothetical protein